MTELEHTFVCAFAQRGSACDCGQSAQYVRGFDYTRIADYCTGPEDEDDPNTAPHLGQCVMVTDVGLWSQADTVTLSLFPYGMLLTL